MRYVETDAESGVRIHQLTDDTRPADNIYGEQPYSPPESNRVAIRFYPDSDGGRDGELAVLDLTDGSLHTIIDTMPRFPAFHGWGEYVYNGEMVDGELLLRRWHWQTLKREDILPLPKSTGNFSYGTVSPDHRWYAVSVIRPDESRFVMRFDIATGEERVIAESTEYYHFKHEQFSNDGNNHVLIQANVLPEVKEVHLGTLSVNGSDMTRLACDQPHTPRPTGHEAWIGTSSSVFFSTAYDEKQRANLFTVGVGDTAPKRVIETDKHFGHVSVSRCGKYWIADTGGEEGVPIYAGKLGTGTMRRLVVSGTIHDGKQWSHTHPYLTADNRWVIYASSRFGRPQVFGAEIPDDFWASLD